MPQITTINSEKNTKSNYLRSLESGGGGGGKAGRFQREVKSWEKGDSLGGVSHLCYKGRSELWSSAGQLKHS